MKSQFSIPAPANLRELRSLLAVVNPIRLSATVLDSNLGVKFVVYPEHCFSDVQATRDQFIADFWERANPYTNRNTECIIRQHGNQTVLQLNSH